MKNGVLFLLVTVALFLQFGCEVIYVSQTATGDGSGDSWDNACTTISEAIEKAVLVPREEEDEWVEIWVAAGRYPEAVELKPHIHLLGGFLGNEEELEERDWTVNETIIDATGYGDSAVTLANDVLLDGFTVTGAKRSGIYCLRSSPEINNCTITNNQAEKGGGLYCRESSPSLENCIFINNTATDGAGGYCYSSSPTFAHCAFINNTATDGGGLNCQDSSLSLSNCSFINNTATDGGGCIFLDPSHRSSVAQ
ncbi:MAG: right-handed parallel beta-helix repeat-containing protein [bacterium]